MPLAPAPRLLAWSARLWFLAALIGQWTFAGFILAFFTPPLLTGDPASTVAAGQSVQGWTVPEFEVDEDDWEDHIIEDL